VADQTGFTGSPFEQAMENFRKTAEVGLGMQQEMMRQWSTSWPGAGMGMSMATPQTAWLEKMREFQKQWSQTVSDLMRKHREVLDNQYRSAIESLEEAFRVGQARDPEQFRQRTEELCRRSLECLRETSEAQMKEFQEATAKWMEMLGKSSG
jgi:uncharacterized protein YwqG